MSVNTKRLFISISQELNSASTRMTSLIGNSHQPTNGAWKESMLKAVLRRHIPRKYSVDTGFIVSVDGQSTQMDIIIGNEDSACLFRDGEVVIAGPDHVAAIVEIKSTLSASAFANDFTKLRDNLLLVRMSPELAGRRKSIGSLYYYENDNCTEETLIRNLRDALAPCSTRNEDLPDVICIGNDYFMKRWPGEYGLYNVRELAPAFLIMNMAVMLSSTTSTFNASDWFPDKEPCRIATFPLLH
jgi:hypothetical protein